MERRRSLGVGGSKGREEVLRATEMFHVSSAAVRVGRPTVPVLLGVKHVLRREPFSFRTGTVPGKLGLVSHPASRA